MEKKLVILADLKSQLSDALSEAEINVIFTLLTYSARCNNEFTYQNDDR